MKLDQFYTKNEIALYFYKILCEKIDINSFDIFLEPSAGKGAFFNLLPNNKRIGLDIEPKAPGILQKDFFDFIPNNNKKHLVIGNPPFNNAVRFFNKSAEFSHVIAFILPRTFNKIRIQNKLNLNFHLLYNELLPLKPCCFEPKMNAKCVFHIWIRKDIKRIPIKLYNIHPDFYFLPLNENNKADFAMKAYGSNCGKLFFENLNSLSKNYHMIKSNININELIKRFNDLNYSISEDTVRQDSLGKKEIIYLYSLKN